MMRIKYIYLLVITLFLVSCSSTQEKTVTTTKKEVDINAQPKAGPAPKINLGKPQIFTLDNGLKVMVVENHKLPRVSATLALNNGPIFEGKKAGVSTLMGAILGSGTTTIEKDTFYENIDYLGAGLSFSSQSANMNSLSQYFPEMLGYMADVIKNPLFTQEEFDSQKNQLIDLLKSNENDVDAIAEQVQNALAYGKNHPNGEFVTLKSLENVNLEDIKNFYDTYFIPNNSYMIVIGDIKFNEVKELVTAQFNNWEKGHDINYDVPLVHNIGKTEIDFVDMPNAVQSNIAITNTVTLKKSDQDYFAALLANKILGAGADARLFNNLREEHGYTYGAYSRLGNDHLTASRFTAYAKVRNEVTDSSVVQFLNEINKIRDEFVTEEELNIAKASYTGSFVRALEKPSTIARYALNIEVENLSKDYYEKYLENINAVTLEEVNEAAKKYFKAEQLRIIIVGKGEDVIPNLEKLPYQINYFDKEGNPITNPLSNNSIPNDLSANTILKKYIEAIGGAEKINNIKSVKTTYNGNLDMGQLSIIEKRIEGKLSQTTSLNGQEMATIIATQSEMYMKQGEMRKPLPEAFLNDTKETLGTFYELAILNNPKAKLKSIEKVNEKDAYKVIFSGPTITTTTYYDIETYLKVKEVSIINLGEEPQVSETLYTNYQSYEGVLFPLNKTAEFGPQVVNLKLSTVLIDKGITNSDF